MERRSSFSKLYAELAALGSEKLDVEKVEGLEDEIDYPFHAAAASGDFEEGGRLIAQARKDKRLEELLGKDHLGNTAEDYARLPKVVTDQKVRSEYGSKFIRFRALIEQVKKEVAENAAKRKAYTPRRRHKPKTFTASAPAVVDPDLELLDDAIATAAGGAGGEAMTHSAPDKDEMARLMNPKPSGMMMIEFIIANNYQKIAESLREPEDIATVLENINKLSALEKLSALANLFGSLRVIASGEAGVMDYQEQVISVTRKYIEQLSREKSGNNKALIDGFADALIRAGVDPSPSPSAASSSRTASDKRR